jgi:hypothetical protein
MRAMSLSRIAVAFLLLPALAAGRALAEPIGETTSVVPSATLSDGGAPQPLEIGTTLQQNDRIATNKDGAAEVEFVDGTSLTIGANSEVVLDKMLFDKNKARNATLNVVRGSLRFVTGSSDHSAYQIKTPVATIGVRGTVIDISVDKGDMVFNTVEGIGVVCHGGTNCRDIRAGDQPIAVNRTGFRIATAAQAARLSRIVTGAHTNLSRRIGRDPRLGKGFQKGLGKGLDKKGLDKKGLDKKGLDKLDKKGLDRKGLDKKGLDKKGLDRLDKKGGLEIGLDKAGLDRGHKKFGEGKFRNPSFKGRLDRKDAPRGKFRLQDLKLR